MTDKRIAKIGEGRPETTLSGQPVSNARHPRTHIGSGYYVVQDITPPPGFDVEAALEECRALVSKPARITRVKVEDDGTDDRG